MATTLTDRFHNSHNPTEKPGGLDLTDFGGLLDRSLIPSHRPVAANQPSAKSIDAFVITRLEEKGWSLAPERERPTDFHQGRDVRLTDVQGQGITEIIA